MRTNARRAFMTKFHKDHRDQLALWMKEYAACIRDGHCDSIPLDMYREFLSDEDSDESAEEGEEHGKDV